MKFFKPLVRFFIRSVLIYVPDRSLTAKFKWNLFTRFTCFNYWQDFCSWSCPKLYKLKAIDWPCTPVYFWVAHLNERCMVAPAVRQNKYKLLDCKVNCVLKPIYSYGHPTLSILSKTHCLQTSTIKEPFFIIKLQSQKSTMPAAVGWPIFWVSFKYLSIPFKMSWLEK